MIIKNKMPLAPAAIKKYWDKVKPQSDYNLVLLSTIPLLWDMGLDKYCEEGSDHPQEIPVHEVIFWLHNYNRFAYSLTLLDLGEIPPPIIATRYRIGADNYYLLTDGSHRTGATHALSRPTIRAQVAGTQPCKVEDFIIHNDFLWRNMHDKSWRMESQELKDEMKSALIGLGVMLCVCPRCSRPPRPSST
jgi:hypothetical protein